MKLFFYKSIEYDPLLFIIVKLSSKEELIKLEELTNEIFLILFNENNATQNNILIFSIIKDYEKSTINLILPSTNSNQELTDNCHKNHLFINKIIIDLLNKSETEFYFEIIENKILIHYVQLNLMSFSKFYKIL